MNNKLLFLFIIFFNFSFSQGLKMDKNSQKIISSLESYFMLERDNIHVQFNKNHYVTNEIIAFTGYVFSKKNNTPNGNTTNINLKIYDSEGKLVKKQLIFASEGTFTGGLQLNDTYKSGSYTFVFYTNWMNNFNENYAFEQKIQIYNHGEPLVIKTKTIDSNNIKVNFYPQAGKIIDNIGNTVGVKIIDCEQKGIEIKNIQILDSKLKEIAKFDTNKAGNGNFVFFADKDEKYTLNINSSLIKFSQPLPQIFEKGIVLTYNAHLPKNKIAIAVRTNEKGQQDVLNKKFYLLIHQNHNAILKDFSFLNNETEHVIILDKTYFSNGVNSLRLIDENLNQVCERLFYYNKTANLDIKLETQLSSNDTVRLKGNSLPKGKVNISVLPENSIGIQEQSSILGTFYLNDYLSKPETNNYFYFDTNNKNKELDMDNLMLNQVNSKISWDNIINKTPKIEYTFNKGITIRGEIKSKVNLKNKRTINIVSTKDKVFEETEVDDKGVFEVKNFFAQDSTAFAIQLTNKNGLAKYSKIETNIIQDEKDYKFPIEIDKTNCKPLENQPEDKIIFDKYSIELSDVFIKLEKKDVLINESQVSGFAVGYKITDRYGTVVDFLNERGYVSGVDNETGQTFVRDSRGRASGSTPSFRINGLQVLDLSELFYTFLSDVEEIYIDKDNYRFAGSNVVIDIFLKTGVQKFTGYRAKHNIFIVSNGFAKNITFKNAFFNSAKQKNLFSTLHWSSNINLEENPNFAIKFDKSTQKNLFVKIEGLLEDGSLISQITKVKVN